MELEPQFEDDKSGIGVEEIKAETEKLMQQSSEASERFVFSVNRYPLDGAGQKPAYTQNTEIIFDADNVPLCGIEKPSNFL